MNISVSSTSDDEPINQYSSFSHKQIDKADLAKLGEQGGVELPPSSTTTEASTSPMPDLVAPDSYCDKQNPVTFLSK